MDYLGETHLAKYYFKNGTQIIYYNNSTTSIKQIIEQIEFENDVVIINNNKISYRSRFKNLTFKIEDWMFKYYITNYQEIKYLKWSDLRVITYNKSKVYKIASWKIDNLYNEIKNIHKLSYYQNIVSLQEIIFFSYKQEKYFVGFCMERLYSINYDNISKYILAEFLMNTVEFIHSKSVFHCDIRRENIMQTSINTLKLIDFDISQTNVTGTINSHIPEAKLWLEINNDLSYLDVLMSTILIYEIDFKISNLKAEYSTIFIDWCKTIKFTKYFQNVQNGIYRCMRTHMESQ